MKTKTAKRIVTFILSAILAIVPVFSAFAAEAENAKIVDSAAGRSVVVQDLVSEGGKAEVHRGASSFAPSKGVRLSQGDTIRTNGQGKIYFAVDSSMILRLDSDSEATITKAAFGQKLTVKLTSGRMFYNVTKHNGKSTS